MARVGDKLGRYELLEQLGKGAAGTVFRARDSLLGIDVCVKILHEGLATQPGIIERFKRELLLARRVAHPGICKIFDIQEAGGTHFLTMEYVKGETLSTILNRDGRMAAKDAVRIMRKVSEALGAAHKAGVVHRDIKPGNIIIGDGERVTIVDFGVATAEDLDRLTRAGVVLGSRSYMAPETWQGKPATAAGDVWALGVILYGCVTGRLPYKGEGVIGVFEAIKTTKPAPPSSINPEVTPALEQLIFKAMCIDVAARFQDATAVESALATLELTLGDDGADTVVRAPMIAKPSSSPSPAASGADEGEPASEPSKPSLSSERLHRPAAQPLPRPPSSPPPSSSLPPTRELPRTPPKSTEEISVIGAEMSLYAPNEPSLLGGSAPSSEQQEPTRVVGPFPDVVRQEAISADNVAEAFDAAFGIAPGATSPAALATPPSAGAGPDTHEPPTVIATVPPDFGPPEGAGAAPAPPDAPSPALAAALGESSLLDVGSVAGPSPAEVSPDATADALPALVGRDLGEAGSDEAELAAAGFVQDKTALTDAPVSLFAPASDESFFASPAAERTRIEVHPLGDDPSPSLEDDGVAASRASGLGEADRVVPVRAGPNKRVLVAVAGVALVVVVGVVALVGGGGDDAEETLAAAGTVTAQADPHADPTVARGSAGGGEGWAFSEEDAEATASGARADEAVAEAATASDEAAPDEAATDEAASDEAASDEAASDEGGADEGATDEGATDEAATDDGAGELAGAEEEGGDAEALALANADDTADDEEPSALESADDDEPAVREPKQRQRPSASAVAKAKYRRKRSALYSALSKKGVLPGDVAAVDTKRRAMTKAARRGDYARAADAADDAMRELAKVQIDATFVGKKLARFNQSYDKSKDEALRSKLKGVLKEVGTDYSKGRYDDANKKLNRAFALMRR